MASSVRTAGSGKPNIRGLWERLEGDSIAVDPNRCVVVRNRNVACRRCAEACTSGCIGVEDGVLRLEPERCVGCGTCATACPAGAISPKNPDDAELFAACDAARLAAPDGAVAIACAAAGAVETGAPVRVACLGRVDESLLVRTVQRGARAVVLVHGDCAACPRARGIETALRVAGSANVLLEAWGSPVRVDVEEVRAPVVKSVPGDGEAPAGGPVGIAGTAELAAARTDSPAVSGAADDAQPAGHVQVDPAAAKAGVPAELDSAESADWADPGPGDPADGPVPVEGPRVVKVTADGTLPHRVPQRRADLLEALAALGEPRDVAVPTRLWGRVDIDLERCRSCRLCSVFCPTGALLRFTDDDGTFGLLHAPGMCVKCRACEDVCATGALHVCDDVPAPDVARGHTARFEMAVPAIEKGGAHSIVNSVRGILGTGQVYER